MNAYIHIFDFDLQWKGMLDSVISLVHRTSWHEMTTSDLRVGAGATGTEELQVGRILVVNGQTDKALIIESITRNLNEPILEINCTDLKSLMNWRVCYPLDYAGATGRKQAEIMMIIPFNNLVSQTRDLDRKFWSSAGASGGKNMFGVTGLKTYGETIDYTIDWNTGYIGDAIVQIAKMNATDGHPIGWNIYINSAYSQFVMDTYQAVDRTASVVFSEEYGNIKNATYVNSNKDWRNVVYVTWTNVDNASTYTPLGNIAYGATVGFNRKEFVYNSSKKTQNEVTAEGRSELNKRPIVDSFTAEIINNPNTLSTYQTNWKLGDLVTVQSRDLAVSVKAQVTEITETYDNGEYTLEAVFNEGQPNLIQKIKAEIERRFW